MGEIVGEKQVESITLVGGKGYPLAMKGHAEDEIEQAKKAIVTLGGTIEDTNTIYKVTYTNDYAFVNVTVYKVWDDNSNQDGIRPDSLTLTLNGLPVGTSAHDPEITKNGSPFSAT